MTHTLDHRMRIILTRLELCSFGSTQAWNASGGGSGEPDDKVVFQVIRRDDPPHLYYRRRYARCRTDEQREDVISEAEAEHLAITVRQSPVEDAPWMPIEQVILQDCEGQAPAFVGARFNMHPNQVMRIRLRDSRDPETGSKPGVVADRPARARELRAQGVSTRQIAVLLSVGQTQVMRWIRTAA